MIKLGAFQYCEIKNPVVRDKDGKLTHDKFGQVKVNMGDSDYRAGSDYTEPFELHPNEVCVQIHDIETIPRNCLGRLVALREFTDGEKKRYAGDEWLIKGPMTYMPRIEVKLEQIIKPITIENNCALQLRAKRACTDSEGHERKDKEEWLIRTPGFYVPQIDEEVVQTVKALTITETSIAQLKALQSFTDFYGVKRRAGDEWQISNVSSHIVEVYEQLVRMVDLTVLNAEQYCYIQDPADENGIN